MSVSRNLYEYDSTSTDQDWEVFMQFKNIFKLLQIQKWIILLSLSLSNTIFNNSPSICDTPQVLYDNGWISSVSVINDFDLIKRRG